MSPGFLDTLGSLAFDVPILLAGIVALILGFGAPAGRRGLILAGAAAAIVAAVFGMAWGYFLWEVLWDMGFENHWLAYNAITGLGLAAAVVLSAIAARKGGAGTHGRGPGYGPPQQQWQQQAMPPGPPAPQPHPGYQPPPDAQEYGQEPQWRPSDEQGPGSR